MGKKAFFKQVGLLFLIFVVLLTLVGTLTQASTEKPQYGGILKIIMNRGPLVFGYPPLIRGSDYVSAYPALEPLLKIDSVGRPVPRLVTAWEVSPDRKSLKLSLRKNVKFHDGTDFNAEAVRYNLEARKSGGRGGLARVTAIDVLDDYTVKLTITKYDSTVLSELAFSTGLMASPTAVKKNGKDWAKTHPVGTGPFQFVKYRRSASLKYKKFDGYWDRGKPYLDGLEFLYIKDPMTASASFQAGEAQIYSRVKPPRHARELEGKGYVLHNPMAAMHTLNGDSANPDSIYAKKSIREAVEYAINKKAIAETLGYGFWEPLAQPCPSTKYGYNPGLKGRSYDPEKAKSLLRSAGYPDGFETKIIIAAQFANRDAMVAVKRDLERVGIKATLDFADRGRWNNHKYKGWNNCLMYMLAGVDPDYTQSLYRVLSSSSPAYPSVRRPGTWDDLLDEALATDDFEKRRALTQKAVRVATDEAMVIPLYGMQSVSAMVKNLHADYYGMHHIQWTPSEAWFGK